MLLRYDTSVYFEDTHTQTVDLSGWHRIAMKSTGFSSMWVTMAASVWADGCKAPLMVIHEKEHEHYTCQWSTSGGNAR